MRPATTSARLGRVAVLGALLALLTAACGTTVDLKKQQASGATGVGLSAGGDATASGGAAPATGSAAAPGGAAGGAAGGAGASQGAAVAGPAKAAPGSST